MESFYAILSSLSSFARARMYHRGNDRVTRVKNTRSRACSANFEKKKRKNILSPSIENDVQTALRWLHYSEMHRKRRKCNSERFRCRPVNNINDSFNNSFNKRKKHRATCVAASFENSIWKLILIAPSVLLHYNGTYEKNDATRT